MEQRQLFGGAITCQMPSAWRDVSQVRDIPDHQECWHDTSVATTAAAMLVMEILERQEAVTDDAAARYFFQDLAEANDCGEHEVDSRFFDSAKPPVLISNLIPPPQQQQPQQQQAPTLCLGSGYQRVAIGRAVDDHDNPRRQEFRVIHVELGVIRLPQQGTDILITLSTPRESNPQQDGENSTTRGVTETFQQIMSSFQIKDWGLFL